MFRSKFSLVSVGIMMALSSGCSVKPASAPRNPILVPEGFDLKTFPVPKVELGEQTNFSYGNNKLFIWKDTTKAPLSGATERNCDADCWAEYKNLLDLALTAGTLNDKLDNEAAPFNRKLNELEASKAVVKKASEGLAAQISVNKKDQASMQAQIDVLAALQPPTSENDAKIQALTDQLELLKKQGVELSTSKKLVDEDFKAKNKEAKNLYNKIDTDYGDKINAVTGPLITALGVDAHGNDNWYKDMPSKVVFRFDENGKIYVEMQGWGIDGKPKGNFSTDDGIIHDVTYEEKGGVFRFVVDNYEDNATKTNLIARYSFGLMRTRHDQTLKDGRLFMIGEFVREAAVCDLMKEPCKRKGSAKLATY